MPLLTELDVAAVWRPWQRLNDPGRLEKNDAAQPGGNHRERGHSCPPLSFAAHEPDRNVRAPDRRSLFGWRRSPDRRYEKRPSPPRHPRDPWVAPLPMRRAGAEVVIQVHGSHAALTRRAIGLILLA